MTVSDSRVYAEANERTTMPKSSRTIRRRVRALLLVTVLSALCLAACVSTAAPRSPLAQVKSYEYESWDTDVTVNTNGSLLVRETQVLNFVGDSHFIYRTLSPTEGKFNDGRNYGRVRFKDIKVFNLDGSRYNDVKVRKLKNGETEVRVNFSASNEQRGWIIEYRQTGSIIYAKDYDRLYFNTVSIQREAPIKSSKTTVRLPAGTDMSKVKTTQYINDSYPVPDIKAGREGDILVWSTGTVPPYGPFTIDVAFPKGIVKIPLTYRSGFGALMITTAFLLILVLCGGIIWRWWTKGRDIGAPALDVVQYTPPPDLKPMEVAFLLHEANTSSDITATIVDLAIHGKLVITEQEGTGLLKHKEYGFQLKDNSGTGLDAFEKDTMNALFESGPVVSQDDLKDKFYTNIAGIDASVKEQVLKKGLFDGDPSKVKGHYSLIGAVLLLLIIPVFWSVSWIDPGWIYVLIPALAICGLTVWIVGRFMSRRTAKGSAELSYVNGFKEYMATAEAEEMKFMTPENFQANLPYAMVLGVSDRWAEKFQNIYTSPPEWFVSYYPGATFSTVYLASSLTTMQTSVGTALASSPSSSSGGGGGFGGGGGGGGFGGGGSGAG